MHHCGLVFTASCCSREAFSLSPVSPTFSTDMQLQIQIGGNRHFLFFPQIYAIATALNKHRLGFRGYRWKWVHHVDSQKVLYSQGHFIKLLKLSVNNWVMCVDQQSTEKHGNLKLPGFACVSNYSEPDEETKPPFWAGVIIGVWGIAWLLFPPETCSNSPRYRHHL